MHTFLKKFLFLWIIFFSTSLFADNIFQRNVTISDASSVYEYNNYLQFSITIESSPPSMMGSLTVHYKTINNGSATAGSDYTYTEGDVIFNSGGVTTKVINIPILNDTIHESTEYVTVEITESSMLYEVTDGQGNGTIYDDDLAPLKLTTFNNKSITETDINQTLTMVAYFNQNLTSDVNVTYHTVDNTASAGSDYVGVAGNTITATAGSNRALIPITIKGDTSPEPTEYFQVFIDSLSSGTIEDNLSMAVIFDNDYPNVDFSTVDFSVIEGNSSTKTLNFHFSLDADAIAGSYFDYYTTDYTAEVRDNDYVAISTTRYTIPEGSRNIDINVTVNGDTNVEQDEYFYLKIINEHYIKVAGHTAKGNIINDDGGLATLKFDKPSYNIVEGNSSTEILNFTLTLDNPAVAGSSFDYYSYDGTAKVSDNDYIKVEDTKHIFSGGETNVTIPVTINGDTDIEDSETFTLHIYNEIDLTFSGTQDAIGKIINDDGTYPKLDIEQSSYSSYEGNSSTHTIDIKLVLDKPALENTSVEYYTFDRSAQDGSSSSEDNDYIATNGTVTIPKDSNFTTLQITINGDKNIEPNELFIIALRNPKNVTLGRSSSGVYILNDDVHNEDPFVCNEYMYLSSSKKRGSEETGKMWLHRIDTTQNPFRFEVMDDTGENNLYNAIGYNPQDNYIYGLYLRNLIKISKTGKIIDLGKINALPAIFDSYQLFAGAVYDNTHYYVAGMGIDTNTMYVINLNDKNVTEQNLSQSINIKDFSLSADGNFLYGIIDGGQFVKINTTTGVVNKVGVPHSGEFDSTFSDKNGRFFANDSQGSGFYEFNINTGTKAFLSNSQPATFNDGTNCLNAELLFTDYGDAPISYGPAWHNIANGVYLGDKVDHDIDSYNTVNADGDDLSGVDDDDGVTLIDGTDINGSYFETNATHQIKVKLSKEAYLKLWIDKGIDGHFDDATDLIYSSGSKLSAGEYTITFSLPVGLTTNTITYLRARVSSSASINPTGFMTDGEVEDYAIKFGSAFQGIKGRFNVQRSNSALNAKDFALYTQIVGRDFDYHVVFYDENMTNEEQLVKVPVRIDLVDATKPMNPPLYTDYYYFSHDDPKSRILVLNNADLNSLPATKEALFKITYAIDSTGSIVQQECGADYKACFESLIASSDANRTDDARDKFSIRPESFYITLADGSQERINSRNPVEKTLKVASGYEYNLSMIATKYGSVEPSQGYNQDFNASFDFNSTGLTSCANTAPITQTVNYIDGIKNIPNFKHNNVGKYRLTQVTDENWTDIDKVDNDCLINNSSTSADGNSKSGCNIQLQAHPIDLEFYPDHFAVDLNLINLPSSSHPDFIYMMELNATNSNVAIAFDGNITAQSEDNTTTTNFTDGCVATKLLLDLNSTTISVEGVDQTIQTIKGTDVNFSRVIHFNSNSSSPIVESNLTLTRIGKVATINKDKFLDENNGTITLDMRYNLNKNLTEPINPIEVIFHGVRVQSTDANSTAHDKTNTLSNIHTPLGEKLFASNNQKNFYFTRVVSDLDNYPTVNLNISPFVRTPLNVDIFCKTSIVNYCQARRVINNTNLAGTTREQGGWYVSFKHNSAVDGNVTNLTANPPIVTISPDSDPSPNINMIMLPNGENGLVTKSFNNCSSPSSTITIETSPALAFEPSQYVVNCTDNNASQWTGVGKTGNILNVKPKVNRSGKMDW